MTWNFGFMMPYQNRQDIKHFHVCPFKLELSSSSDFYWFNMTVLNFYVNNLYDKETIADEKKIYC